MHEKIRHRLRASKISEMQNPTIMINSEDFESFKTELSSNGQNFKIPDNPTYKNMPIKINDKIQQGTVVIYDDSPQASLCVSTSTCEPYDKIKQKFCTYRISLELKELGFDDECIGCFASDCGDESFIFSHKFRQNSKFTHHFTAPLWQEAIDWFREKHKLFIVLDYWGERNVKSANNLFEKLFGYTICQELLPKEKWITKYYDTYEEAREQAILKAIELCKNNL